MSEKAPLASVIVLTWNGLNFIKACLDSVLAQTYPEFEVIVVDNASTDGSDKLVAEKFPQVRLICNERNLGFSGGCNVGLKAARGDILVLLNQDTQVRPDWLHALNESLGDSHIGVVGCKIFYPDGETLQHAGGWIEWPLGLAHHYGQDEKNAPAWDIPRAVEYVTGAAIAFRREVMERIGLLDEGFWPGYFEDADFCLRARAAGYEIWYNPNAVLQHKESSSLTDQRLLSQAYQRGRLRFILKHTSPRRFLAEFVPAEAAYQPPAIHGNESNGLRLAYMETISGAIDLLYQHWQADEPMIYEIVTALQRLHHQAWLEDWKRTEDFIATIGPKPVDQRQTTAYSPNNSTALPSLQEFEFRSETPVIGVLIARFRSLWYSVAARWAVRYLIHQQGAINQQLSRQFLHYVTALERRLVEMVEEQTLLTREIIKLKLQIQQQLFKGDDR